MNPSPTNGHSNGPSAVGCGPKPTPNHVQVRKGKPSLCLYHPLFSSTFSTVVVTFCLLYFFPSFLCLFLIYDLVPVRVDPFSVVTVDPCKYSVPPQSKEEFSGNFLYFTYIFLYFTCIFPLLNSYFCLQ